jgi:uncharacterized membrane protein YuzA (DUF378 family)
MKNFNMFDWITLAILIIGGLSWGLIGVFGFDVVSALFGNMTTLTRVIYSIVGLSGLYVMYLVSAKLD